MNIHRKLVFLAFICFLAMIIIEYASAGSVIGLWWWSPIKVKGLYFWPTLIGFTLLLITLLTPEKRKT